MKNFIVIYHGPADAMKQNADVSQEEMKKGMEDWMVWAEKCGENLVDMGAPLTGGVILGPEGTSGASKRDVVGFSILKAKDMQEAKTLMDGHPHLNWRADCEIEIHETMPLPG